jgi:hypothetical protein
MYRKGNNAGKRYCSFLLLFLFKILNVIVKWNEKDLNTMTEFSIEITNNCDETLHKFEFFVASCERIWDACGKYCDVTILFIVKLSFKMINFHKI